MGVESDAILSISVRRHVRGVVAAVMVSDSPYAIREPILSPGQGAMAGVGAALAMMAFLEALQRVSGFQPSLFVTQVGSIVLPVCSRDCGPSLSLLIGLGTHCALGAVFGLLYAVCHQRVPSRGLVAVGIFYGFFLWIVSSLAVGPMVGESLRKAIRSWPWASASLLYGGFLALTAVWVDHRRPRPLNTVVPLD